MELTKRTDDRMGTNALQRQFNRLFGDFFGAPLFWPPKTEGELFPALDVAENAEAVVVTAEIPGIEAKDLTITVNDNLLTIRGEKAEEKETKGKTWHRVERQSGVFERIVALPAPVFADKVEAVTRNGVLTVTMPKTREAKAKQIQVKTA